MYTKYSLVHVEDCPYTRGDFSDTYYDLFFLGDEYVWLHGGCFPSSDYNMIDFPYTGNFSRALGWWDPYGISNQVAGYYQRRSGVGGTIMTYIRYPLGECLIFAGENGYNVTYKSYDCKGNTSIITTWYDSDCSLSKSVTIEPSAKSLAGLKKMDSANVWESFCFDEISAAVQNAFVPLQLIAAFVILSLIASHF